MLTVTGNYVHMEEDGREDGGRAGGREGEMRRIIVSLFLLGFLFSLVPLGCS